MEDVPAAVSEALDEAPVASSLVLACVGLLAGALLRFVETQLVPMLRFRLRRFTLPPYTLSVFLVGAAASALYDAEARRLLEAGASSWRGEAHLLGAIASAQLIEPHVILLVFLPPLIYESSSSMNYHMFRRVRWQALVLAFPGVLVQTCLVAAAMRHLSGYGPAEQGGRWDWNVALTFGAIVCATDPVAVVSTLRAIGAPERLSDIIEGESLLNNGSAMVVFAIFAHNATVAARGLEEHTWASGSAFFLRLSLGGVALGGCAFYAVVGWLTFVENDVRVEVAVLIVAVYGCFALAELGAGVSGILTVVTMGLLMGRRGQYTFSPQAASAATAVLPMLAFVSETLIFFVGGVAAWTALSSHADEIAWWHAIPLYCGLMLARAAATALFFPFLACTGYRVTTGEAVIVVYAGLRGAVGLALSLLVVRDPNFPALDKDRIHFLVGSVVVLTMAVNGTTASHLYEWLQLYPASKFRGVLVREAVAKLEGPGMAEIREELISNAELHLYNLADWQIVRMLVPQFAGARLMRNGQIYVPEAARIDPLAPALVLMIATSVPRFAHKEHAARGDASDAAADDDMSTPASRTAGCGCAAPSPPRCVSAPSAEPQRSATAERHAAEAAEASATDAPTARASDASPAAAAESTRPETEQQALSASASYFGASEPPCGDVHADPRAADPRCAWRSEAAAHRRAEEAPPAAQPAQADECYSAQEESTELVGSLFSVLRRAYAEQYEAKQLDGLALAACMEGISSGEEYLSDHPLASASAAFELELDVLLFELPAPSPSWLPGLLSLPILGAALWRGPLFRRTYTVTEALAAFVHAHDALSDACEADSRKAELVRASVEPVAARARRHLREHRQRYWSLTTLEINLLTARAAIGMKGKQVRALAAAGDLSSAHADQLSGALDSALYAIETIRYSPLAARRFHITLRRVLRLLDSEEGGAAVQRDASVL